MRAKKGGIEVGHDRRIPFPDGSGIEIFSTTRRNAMPESAPRRHQVDRSPARRGQRTRALQRAHLHDRVFRSRRPSRSRIRHVPSCTANTGRGCDRVGSQNAGGRYSRALGRAERKQRPTELALHVRVKHDAKGEHSRCWVGFSQLISLGGQPWASIVLSGEARPTGDWEKGHA